MARKRSNQPYQSIISRLRFDSPALRRSAVTIVAAVILCALAYAIGMTAIKSSVKKQEVVRLEQQRDEKLREKRQLLKQKTWLQSPEGIADSARRKGMIGPNEELVRFNPPQDKVIESSESALSSPEPTLDSFLLAGFFLFMLAFIAGIGLLVYRRRAMLARRPEGTLTPRSELRKRRRPIRETM